MTYLFSFLSADRIEAEMEAKRQERVLQEIEKRRREREAKAAPDATQPTPTAAPAANPSANICSG